MKLLNTPYCLDTYQRGSRKPLGLFSCDRNSVNPSKTQNFELSSNRDFRLRFSKICLDSYGLVMHPCHNQFGNQEVKFKKTSKQIFFVKSGKCVEGNMKDRSKVILSPCDEKNNNQKWVWGFLNETVLKD